MLMKMSKKVVLSTIVDEEFANAVKKYCEGNGFTPSSLLKALLEEELNNKKPLTAIYNGIDQKFNELSRLTLIAIRNTTEISFILTNWIKTWFLKEFGGKIPEEYQKDFKTLEKYSELLKQDLNTIKRMLEGLK